MSPLSCGAAALLLLCCCAARPARAQPADGEGEWKGEGAGGGGECVIELSCAECVPENAPLVTSHSAADGVVRVPHGDEVTLSCAGGKFLEYPALGAVTARCESGRYRVAPAAPPRHLLDLGCQENLFEDVLHQVAGCAAPLQGRAYQLQEAGGGTRHLATLCYDADRAVAVRAHCSTAPLDLPAHSDTADPLSLLGNFKQMFDARTRGDAARLYGDPAHMTRRLAQLLRHEAHAAAPGLGLVAGKLLDGAYFADQDARVTDFDSNKVPVWSSVASGNLRHLHRDVAALLRRGAGAHKLDVYAGTHGTLTLRTERALHLQAGGRFPVPRYVWTVVVDRARAQAVALVLLNDPYVPVSEIRDALFCESACGRVRWARELRRRRRYETPLYGLAFCCNVHQFADVVTELPRDLVRDVPRHDAGLLTQLP